MSIQRTLLVSLCLSSALLSGVPATAAELKVGIVDQRRGILTTDQGKQAQKDLEKLAEERKNRLKPAQDDFQKKQEELESQRFVLSETALEERMLELEKQRRELERDVQAVRDDPGEVVQGRRGPRQGEGFRRDPRPLDPRHPVPFERPGHHRPGDRAGQQELETDRASVGKGPNAIGPSGRWPEGGQ
jgi:hypothetical protein